MEWRSQRIRTFDCYSADYNRQDARELRAKDWQAWPIQVRSFRKTCRMQNAGELLASMEQRTKVLVKTSEAYWDAPYVLAEAE